VIQMERLAVAPPYAPAITTGQGVDGRGRERGRATGQSLLQICRDTCHRFPRARMDRPMPIRPHGRVAPPWQTLEPQHRRERLTATPAKQSDRRWVFCALLLFRLTLRIRRRRRCPPRGLDDHQPARRRLDAGVSFHGFPFNAWIFFTSVSN